MSQPGCKSLFLSLLLITLPGRKTEKHMVERKRGTWGSLRSSPFSRFPAFWWDLVIKPVQVRPSM